MPINAGPEYFAAEKKYSEARSREERIAALEEMIRTLPKHKGTDHHLAQLKSRLAKLKRETTIKASSKPRFSIRKEGDAQICILGLTNCGKSSLLQMLTGVDAEIADYPFTTKLPEVGMMSYGDVQLQVVEIPSTFDADFMSIVQGCDEIVVLLDGEKNIFSQETDLNKILKDHRLANKIQLWVVNKADNIVRDVDKINISAKNNSGIDKLKEELWKKLCMIRVYTKSPGKPKLVPAIALPVGSSVQDVARKVHKDLLQNFAYARIFDATRFSGQKVGLEFVLKDLDVVEIHTK